MIVLLLIATHLNLVQLHFYLFKTDPSANVVPPGHLLIKQVRHVADSTEHGKPVRLQ